MKLSQRMISAALTGALTLSMVVNPLAASAADKGKYIQDVYIAYGSDEADAASHLPEGYEAVKGNFNDGRHSETAVVMGIKRTSDPNLAVTDMRLMDMKGSYSFSDYEELLGDKKNEIVQFIDGFMPTIQEFRENYKKGKGSNKERAEFAKQILDKFIDGDPADPQARHDTGMHLGDLLLGDMSHETDNYLDMSRNEQAQHGDLVQIILEGNGKTVTTMKQALAIAADTGETSWLDRVSTDYSVFTGDSTMTASQARQEMAERYEDKAVGFQKQWESINSEIAFYCDYNDSHYTDAEKTINLWQQDNETAEDYEKRLESYFDTLRNVETSEEKLFNNDEIEKYYNGKILYNGLANYTYSGDWGDTLLDFFFPAEGVSLEYKDDVKNFYGLCAALSKGQIAASDIISLHAFLMVGLGSERFKQSMFSEYMETMNQLEDVDLYQGVNREIFRKGVAVTSAAMATNNHSELQEYLFGNTSQSRDAALIATGAGLGFTLLGAGCLWISNGANQAANITGNDIVDIIDEMEGNNVEAANIANNAIGNQAANVVNDLNQDITTEQVSFSKLVYKFKTPKTNRTLCIVQADYAKLIDGEKNAAIELYNDRGDFLGQYKVDGEFKGEAGNTLMRRMGNNTNELGDQTFEFEQGLPDAEPGKTLYKTVDKPVDKQVANPNIEQEQVANDPTLNQESKISGAKIVGWTMVGIGAVLFVAGLTTYIVKMYQYHNPTFTQIPNYIVDRSDIEEFDANGNRIGLNFKDFTYYRVVNCNRQELGVSSSAKKGVSDYEAMGCGSAADLNGDVGPQWMALYTVRDAAKGSPILADSLLLQTGSSEMPAKCDTALRFFNYDFAVNLGDDAYAYHNEKNGVYFFWDQDEKAVASQTASVFGTGSLALAGVLGLAVGAVATALFFAPRRKKEQTA